MKKTDNTKLITVGQLVKELEKYDKKHWDWNVEISTDELALILCPNLAALKSLIPYRIIYFIVPSQREEYQLAIS